MRAAQIYEEEEEIRASDADLHLGMGSLIGIFFGLALVCGVFFGFGYLMGHRNPGAYVSSEPLYEKHSSAPVAPKPSAQVPVEPSDAARVVVPTTAPENTVQTDQAAVAPALKSASPALTTAPLALAQKPQSAAAKQEVSAQAAAPPTASVQPVASQPSTGTIMVQIAAVKSRSDAEALAAALQKNGFNATVRTEAQDKFLHVQVGPFDNRDEAKAMRQKLTNAGYNAFIK
jgi:DedD protein